MLTVEDKRFDQMNFDVSSRLPLTAFGAEANQPPLRLLSRRQSGQPSAPG